MRFFLGSTVPIPAGLFSHQRSAWSWRSTPRYLFIRT